MLLTRSSGSSLSQQVYSILQKYGTDAHVYLPGIGVINGLTAGNYLDSAGTTAATVDNPVGLVVDSGGINAIQATTANKPILRRGAVNLLTYSEQFDNAAWVKQGVLPFGSGSTANAIAAPNGTLTADKIVESSTTGVHRLDQVIAVSAIPYTTSVYAKAGGSSWLQLRDATSTAGVWFNINTGVIGAVASGSSGTIKSVGDGWYRCTATRTAIAGSNTYSIALANADNSNSYTGDGTSGIYIWGAQLETGSVATDYISTTTAAASSATGNYHWVHDSTDVLTATFPAGYEAATTINASTAGQATLTAQNIVGAYNIGPSIDTYGRFIFKTIEASELAIVQSYCNRLAGV